MLGNRTDYEQLEAFLAAPAGAVSAQFRDSLMLDALAEAVTDVTRRYGADTTAWRWGAVHVAELRHPLTKSFDLPPVARGGDGNTVFATGGANYRQTSGASYRQVIDLGDFGRVVTNYDKRKFDTEVPGADAIVAERPNYAVAARSKRGGYESRRDDDRVIQEVNQTIKSNSAPAAASLNHANLLFGTRKYDSAIPYYDKVLKLQPGNAEALNYRGALAMLGELNAALEDCNEALRIKPNNPSALDHRGLAYLKLGKPDEALDDYNQALKINPESPQALFGRGVAKLMKGDTVLCDSCGHYNGREIVPIEA